MRTAPAMTAAGLCIVLASAWACQRADQRAARVLARQTADERAALEADDRALQAPPHPGGPGTAAAPGEAVAPGWPELVDGVLDQVRRLTHELRDPPGRP